MKSRKKWNSDLLDEASTFRRPTITSLLNVMFFLFSMPFTIRASRFAWKTWGCCQECREGGGWVLQSMLSTLIYDKSVSQYLCSHWRNRWGLQRYNRDSFQICRVNRVLKEWKTGTLYMHCRQLYGILYQCQPKRDGRIMVSKAWETSLWISSNKTRTSLVGRGRGEAARAATTRVLMPAGTENSAMMCLAENDTHRAKS